MREILFRGKIIDTKDWAFGSLVYSPSENQYYIIGHCGEELSFSVDTETIGQYTGLCDKKGEPIFEGDCIKARHNDCHYLCKFEDCAFKLVDENGNVISMRQEALNRFECEIIGNIHDNPEFSEVEE